MAQAKITIVTTGGTIEKTYDEGEGILSNREPGVSQDIIPRLRLPHTSIEVLRLMCKDSLEMTEEDRKAILQAVKGPLASGPVIVIHGTDTMTVSAEYCLKHLPTMSCPLIFTGAMKPVGFEKTDAYQNVAEALLAAKLIGPGVYISFHNHVFAVPGVRKNRQAGTFEAV